MKNYVLKITSVLIAVFAFTACALAQNTNVSGEVTAVDATAHTVTLKTEQGTAVVAKTDDKTALLRVPAGQTSLADAAKIQFADVVKGDKVLARGVLNTEKTELAAIRIVIISKTDIDAMHKQELDDWRKRGVFGVVKSADAAANEITLESKVPTGTSMITVHAAKAGLMRYAQTSMNFADAKPGTFADIKPGDQLRALGTKSEDGKTYTAEKIISGSFATVGVTITEVDAANNIIKGTTLDKKKPITLTLVKDSVIHRIPQQMAAIMARRLLPADPNAQNGGNGNGAAPPNGGQPAQGGPGGPGGPGGQRPPMDIAQMIDSLPNVALSDLKAGDVLAVAISNGADETHANAIKLVAGMDGVISAMTTALGRRQQNTSLSSGLPSGFDFGVIQP